MSDSLPKKRNKRGRPPKQPEKYIKQAENRLNPNNIQTRVVEKPKGSGEILEIYNNYRNAFTDSGVSQQSQLLIRRIAINISSNGDFSSQPVLRILNEILQELTLNELEVVS